ncbi:MULTISPECIES: DUF1236 domain-containing protein [unclassified Rhizobium]|jgi:uncharacterized protein YraI|uniref:DUF1236 domain-containing protein n=1 Tax=unclassified Rhizobium TaxID=2613769 RepID=UPI0006479E2A|nr:MULTISPECIES: DUF1236 domain-containing protein [unclassified Rhizobium]MBN8951351.1 DUF1236 domain-containing protein [Rhizobium tropici]OJY74829.1 MAG: hypothetical protein BGP09_33940 [Rhizobium sp. 60-20]RKD66654.1 SH3 domain-containing protein [Rhizobium sp. WW_1]
MSLKRNLLLASFALLGSAGLAQAETAATTATDIEVRSGPGAEFPTVGVATRGSEATLDGCVEGSRWCRVDVNGMRGWVYAQYLSVEQNGASVVVQDHRDDLGIPTITYEQTDPIKTGSVETAQPGPNDQLLGSVDQNGGEVVAITPPEEIRTYIDDNPVDTVQLSGDLAVGATVPQSVEVHRIPDYQYSYVEVNHQPVLVDPGTRRIVYVYR